MIWYQKMCRYFFSKINFPNFDEKTKDWILCNFLIIVSNLSSDLANENLKFFPKICTNQFWICEYIAKRKLSQYVTFTKKAFLFKWIHSNRFWYKISSFNFRNCTLDLMQDSKSYINFIICCFLAKLKGIDIN